MFVVCCVRFVSALINVFDTESLLVYIVVSASDYGFNVVAFSGFVDVFCGFFCFFCSCFVVCVLSFFV